MQITLSRFKYLLQRPKILEIKKCAKMKPEIYFTAADRRPLTVLHLISLFWAFGFLNKRPSILFIAHFFCMLHLFFLQQKPKTWFHAFGVQYKSNPICLCCQLFFYHMSEMLYA